MTASEKKTKKIIEAWNIRIRKEIAAAKVKIAEESPVILKLDGIKSTSEASDLLLAIRHINKYAVAN